MIVYKATSFSGDFHGDLDMLRRQGNHYCSWQVSVFPKDVIQHMKGNFKRIYDYLNLECGVEPSVAYWTDGGGMKEGFSIALDWSKK